MLMPLGDIGDSSVWQKNEKSLCGQIDYFYLSTFSKTLQKLKNLCYTINIMKSIAISKFLNMSVFLGENKIEKYKRL